jgi:hypothetical protein
VLDFRLQRLLLSIAARLPSERSVKIKSFPVPLYSRTKKSSSLQKKKDMAAEVFDQDGMDITPLPTAASKIKNPPMMAAMDIKHPFSMQISGASGSGKTVLCMNMLLKKNFFYRYFDEIYLITPTGGADDSFQQLGLPEGQIITKNFIEELEKIIEKQDHEVKSKGIEHADKVCVIFEDLTSLRKLMNSEAFVQAFVQNRHLNISSIAVCHKYNALVRTARLSCNHVCVFPCTGSEKKILENDQSANGIEGKLFYKMLDEAFSPEEGMPRPFVHICKKGDIARRFRKSFKHVILLYAP